MSEPTFRERGLLIVADDNKEYQGLFRDMLAEIAPDIGLATVGDGEQLLALIRSRREAERSSGRRQPSVVLLDVQMPVMGGIEAIRQMKADPDLSRIPVVALTVSEDEQDVRDMYDLRANAYIVKPQDPEGMRVVIDGLVGFWFDAAKLARRV